MKYATIIAKFLLIISLAVTDYVIIINIRRLDCLSVLQQIISRLVIYFILTIQVIWFMETKLEVKEQQNQTHPNSKQ